MALYVWTEDDAEFCNELYGMSFSHITLVNKKAHFTFVFINIYKIVAQIYNRNAPTVTIPNLLIHVHGHEFPFFHIDQHNLFRVRIHLYIYNLKSSRTYFTKVAKSNPLPITIHTEY